jgi:hypothetical protein
MLSDEEKGRVLCAATRRGEGGTVGDAPSVGQVSHCTRHLPCPPQQRVRRLCSRFQHLQCLSRIYSVNQ